jgi:hypothetical protein
MRDWTGAAFTSIGAGTEDVMDARPRLGAHGAEGQGLVQSAIRTAAC